jgi:hypothetical protein
MSSVIFSAGRELLASVALAVLLTTLYGCVKDQETGPTKITWDKPSGGQFPYDAVELKPARTNWQPGLVFIGSVDGTQIIVDETVCPNLFPGVQPQKGLLASFGDVVRCCHPGVY